MLWVLLTFATHLQLLYYNDLFDIIRHLLTLDVADTSVLYRWFTPRLLQLNPIWSLEYWSCNAYTIHWLQQPKRSDVEPLLRTFNCSEFHYKVGYQDMQEPNYTSTHDYVTDIIPARTSGTRMSLRLASHTLLAIPSTRMALASRAFSVCTRPINRATVLKQFLFNSAF